MDNKQSKTYARFGAYTALSGAVSMFIGAALLGASGIDLDSALADGDMLTYLAAAEEVRLLLIANLTAWIMGVLLLGIAGVLLQKLCTQRRTIAHIALVCYQTAVPLAIAAFVAMLAVNIQISPNTSANAVLLAEVIGWFGSRADWIATILIIGVGPALLSLAGRDEWVPRWLARWGMATTFTSLLTTVAIFTGSLSSAYAFLIIPVGLGWNIAAGVMLLRRS